MNNHHPAFKQLLACSLREKPESYIVKEILQRFPTYDEIMEATEQELLEINGIGITKARQFIATIKLSRILAGPIPVIEKIQSPQDVQRFIEAELRYEKQEHFICILLNTKNFIISKETISIGTLNASLVHPREVFRPAIKRAAASIICVHNHPSGNPDPSPEDISITKRLIEAGQTIGIEVLDHIIIGGNSYVSLKERGYI